MTRLDKFLKSRGVRFTQLHVASGVSRQHIGRLRRGAASATLSMAVKLTRACRKLLGDPSIRVGDLFDLDG